MRFARISSPGALRGASAASQASETIDDAIVNPGDFEEVSDVNVSRAIDVKSYAHMPGFGGSEWRKTAKSGFRARSPRGIRREIARGIPLMLDTPGNFPGSRMRPPCSRGVGRSISKFPGNSPVDFPGFGISLEIPREVGRGIRLPGKFPGKSAAPDCGGPPWELIELRS